MDKKRPGNAEAAENGQEARTTATAASGAGLLRASTPWSRASGSSLRSDHTPAERAGGRGGREVERSETSADPACTTRRASVAPRNLGGAPLAPPSSMNDGPEAGGVGRRQVLQGLLAGVGAAIPGATRAQAMTPAAASPAAVQAAAAKAKAADWKPEFLDAHQLATVQSLCERIVPGSLAARSDRFIDALLAVDTRDSKQRFVSALGAMEADARLRFGKPFKSLSEAQQNEILSAASAGKPGREDWVWTPGTIVRQPEPAPPKTTTRDHFDNLKQWIVGAYYSSEAGMKELGSTGQMFFAGFPDCDHEGGHS